LVDYASSAEHGFGKLETFSGAFYDRILQRTPTQW
jgi:hypothetical protein